MQSSDLLPPKPISTAELDLLTDTIATLAANLHAATHQLLVLIAELDETRGWAIQGARSCAHWLSWRIGLDLGAAREKVRVARALRELPRVSEAFAAGKLSYSKVRAISRIADESNEQRLLELALDGTASHVEKVVRGYRKAYGAKALEQAAAQREERHLRAYWDAEGMLVIQGRLSPEEGARVMAALEAAKCEVQEESRTAEPSVRGPSQHLWADALVRVAEQAVGDGGLSAEVVVHVDAAVLQDSNQGGRSHFEEGADVSAETSRRLACDSALVVAAHAPTGELIDVGRRTRAIPPALRRALRLRDGGCRFPGCTNSRFVDGHHVKHWADGGETKLSNLVTLCRAHHRCVHEEGYRVERIDERFVFFGPDGHELPQAPAAPLLSDDPTADLIARNLTQGLAIDPHTCLPHWQGERLDLALAVEVMRSSPLPALTTPTLPQ